MNNLQTLENAYNSSANKFYTVINRDDQFNVYIGDSTEALVVDRDNEDDGYITANRIHSLIASLNN